MKQAGRISERQADWMAGISRVLLGILLVCIFCFTGGGRTKAAMAAGASITISTKNNTVQKGDTVYVVVKVSSSKAIKGFEGHFRYNKWFRKDSKCYKDYVFCQIYCKKGRKCLDYHAKAVSRLCG